MKTRKWRSIYSHLIPLSILLGVMQCFVILFLGAALYRSTVETHYVILGRRLAQTVAGFLDGDAVDRYLATGVTDGVYEQTLARLCTLARCDEVAYLYVVRLDAESMRYVFDTGDEADAHALGAEVTYSASRSVLAPRPIRGTEGSAPASGTQGRLTTIFEPIYTSRGALAGYVGVDMAMASLDGDWVGFVTILMASVLAATGLMLTAAMLMLRRTLVRPLNAMVTAADDFLQGAPRGGADLSSIEALDIRTGDELEHLAHSLKAMERRTKVYIDSLSTATREAETDMLTGLYNRTAFERKVGQLLHGEVDPQAIHAFFILDVDKFKHVNDKYGHLVGDEVLVECARVLRKVFRSADLLARLGGDEFTVFCAGAGSLEVVRRKAHQLCAAWRGILLPNGASLSTSVGVALAPESGDSYEALYRRADDALYAAKSKGRSCFVIHGHPEGSCR